MKTYNLCVADPVDKDPYRGEKLGMEEKKSHLKKLAVLAGGSGRLLPELKRTSQRLKINFYVPETNIIPLRNCC
jgi:hypothetical protein